SAIHEHRPDLPEVSSRQHHLLPSIRVPREFHSGAQPRRNRVRQTLAVIQDAGRRMAEVCQSADVSRVDVRAARQKAALHGRRIWPVERMEPRHTTRLGTTEVAAPRQSAPAGATLELYVQK